MKNRIDCLFIGHNEMSLDKYTEMVHSMGEDSCAARDLSLSLCKDKNQTYTATGLFNQLYNCNHKHTELSPAIAYLATFLHRHNFNFDILNSFQKEELKQKLIANDYLTIAITTTLYVVPFPIMEIVSFIRQHNLKAKIIVGGPFIASQAEALSSDSLNMLFKTIGADFYVINSQGEQALINILEATKANKPLEKIANIAYKSNGNYCITQSIREQNELSENMVDWKLFPDKVLGSVASLRSSISCPYNCAFCGFPRRGGKYKYIQPEVLAQNLDSLHQNSKVNFIHFIDDTFNVPQERFKSLMQMMIKNNYRFRWTSTLRCQFIDRETLELMRKAGCVGVFLGIESGCDRILKNMNKNATAASYAKGLKLLNEYDFITYASFIIGFPGETASTAEATLDFIQETKPTFYRTQLWYCDPITPIWTDKEKYKIRGSGFQWEHSTMSAVTACDIIENIFRNVDNSTWLPQHDFETYNLYFLLNQGFSIAEIKKFLQHFNTLAKKNLKSRKQIKQHDEFNFS